MKQFFAGVVIGGLVILLGSNLTMGENDMWEKAENQDINVSRSYANTICSQFYLSSHANNSQRYHQTKGVISVGKNLENLWCAVRANVHTYKSGKVGLDEEVNEVTDYFHLTSKDGQIDSESISSDDFLEQYKKSKKDSKTDAIQ